MVLPGKLIAFEGIDASGKTTQARLLMKQFKQHGYKAVLFSIPTKTSFFGKILHKFLHGEIKNNFSPEEFALLFALDRYSLKQKILQLLSEGKILVFDRYKASLLAYQTAMAPEQERDAFLEWALHLEKRLPDEDLTLLLDVPPERARLLLEKRKNNILDKKALFQKDVYLLYNKLFELNPDWKKIGCIENGKLLSKKEIAEKIWPIVEEKIK